MNQLLYEIVKRVWSLSKFLKICCTICFHSTHRCVVRVFIQKKTFFFSLLSFLFFFVFIQIITFFLFVFRQAWFICWAIVCIGFSFHFLFRCWFFSFCWVWGIRDSCNCNSENYHRELCVHGRIASQLCRLV